MTTDDTRGKRGANKSSVHLSHGNPKCHVCGREDDADLMIVAHQIGEDSTSDHVDICSTCPIPEGFWGCGCGG